MPEYPVSELDVLGREVVLELSPGVKIVKTYWGKTNKVKVRYRIYNSETEFAVYDFNEKVIISNDGGIFRVTLKNLKITSTEFKYKVKSEILENWKTKYKNYGNQNNK